MPPKPLRRLAGQCLGHLMSFKVPSGLQRLAMRPCSTPGKIGPPAQGGSGPKGPISKSFGVLLFWSSYPVQ